MCEEYQEKDAVLYPVLYTKAKALYETFEEQFNHVRWNEPCGQMVAQSDDQMLATQLNHRKHQIGNSLCAQNNLYELKVILKHELEKASIAPSRKL